jgi:hypothetical protein
MAKGIELDALGGRPDHPAKTEGPAIYGPQEHASILALAMPPVTGNRSYATRVATELRPHSRLLRRPDA